MKSPLPNHEGADLPAGKEPPESLARTLFRQYWWEIVAGGLVLLAALIRLCYLTVAPLHHDEGVNGNFLIQLYRSGEYKYDPQNYHGPSLYYIALVATRVAGLLTGEEGLTTFAIKLVPAVFGIALVWLVLQLRRELGDYGAIGAAVLAALSPGAVYFSRYFIHEILFVFFSLAVIVALLFYVRTLRPVYLMLLSASLALLVATKETSVITLAVLALAYACTAAFQRMVQREDAAEAGKKTQLRNAGGDERPDDPLPLNPTQGLRVWRERVGRQKWQRNVLQAAALFAVIHVCLFSSFFGLATAIKFDRAAYRAHGLRAALGFDSGQVLNHLDGVAGSVLTYKTWTETAGRGYLAPADQYLTWMGRMEFGTLVLGGAGIALALIRGKSRFGIFAAFYAMGELAAYSLIPYKTPWLTLSILLPFWLAGGYAVAETVAAVRRSTLQRDKIGAWAGMVIVVAGTGWQSIDLSHIRYDDNSLTYVYAHTRRSFVDMTDEIDRIVTINQLGPEVGITVMAPEHWPLPWYTRYYRNAGYWSKVIQTEEAIIVGQDHQRQEIERTVGSNYTRVGTYDMRPGVILDLYIRNDLAR